MATLNELLAKAAQIEIPTTSPAPTLDPNTALNAVITQRTNAGATSAPTIEEDLANMGPAALYLKYGNAAEGLINARVNARGQLDNMQASTRTNAQALGDTAIDVVSGAANLVAGPLALGAGLVDPATGAALSQDIQRANQWAQDQQSDALNDRRQVADLTGKLKQRDTTQQFNQDVKTDGSFVASLKRIGRDVVDSISTAYDDSMTLTSGIAQGVGSILPIGPAAAGIKAATGIGSVAARNAANVANAINPTIGTRIAAGVMNTADDLVVSALIGGTTAGSTYQQTVNDVSKMTDAELMQNSPTFRALVNSGITPQEARIEVQHRSGLMAAAVSGPASMAAGRLVSRFEGAPLAAVSARTAVGNLARETLEEGIQSGAEKLGQNIGTQTFADSTKTLSEGVGEQIGQGALYGLGTAGAVQAPSLVAGTAAATVKGFAAAASAASTALQKSADAQRAKNEENAPTSEKNIRAVMEQAPITTPADVQAVNSVIAETVAPENQEVLTKYVSDVVNINRLTPEELADASKSDSIRQIYETSADRLEVMTRLADEIVKTKADDLNGLLEKGGYFYTEAMKFENLLANEPEGIASIKGQPGTEVLDYYSNLASMINSNPKINNAVAEYHKRLVAAAEADKLPKVTEQNVATPQGAQAAQATVALAQVAPEKADLESVKMVLKHASAGDMVLTPAQENALKNSRALLESAQAYDKRVASLSVRPQDIVSKEIKTANQDGERLPSGLQHSRAVYNAVQSGDTALAAELLTEMGMFAQHMQNKVGALNRHFLTGNNDRNALERYQSLTPSRKWVESKEGLGVTRTSPGSIRFAQEVSLEADFMTNLFNNMVDAFPDLGVSKMGMLSLDPGMEGNAELLAKQYSTPTKPVTLKAAEVVETKVETKPVVEQSAPEKVAEEPAPTPVPVQEEKPKTGTEALFPSLVQPKNGNQFLKAFKVPKNPKSRLLSSESPLADVAGALASAGDFNSFTGKDIAGLDKDVAAAYLKILRAGRKLSGFLEENLQKALKTNKIGERLASGEEVNRFYELRTLNLVEPTKDGFQYNKELREGAVLAGLQWLVNFNELNRELDEDDVASYTGVKSQFVGDALVAAVNVGVGTTPLITSLAQKIESYWGLSKNGSAPLAYTTGIPQAMAGEILRVFEETGMLVKNQIRITEQGTILAPNEKGAWKTLDHYSVDPEETLLGSESPLRKAPHAIDEAVLVDPVRLRAVGSMDNLAPVAKKQLRSEVPLTEEQIQALKNERETQYFFDLPMLNFYAAMGMDSILELFGEGDLDKRVMNKNHKLAAEGKNKGLIAAFNELMGLALEVQSQETPDDATPIFYSYEMTSVGRMQMMGLHNPQSSKLMREAVLPTWSTLDLSSNNDQYGAYMLGLAQALGVKVHTMSLQASIDAVQKRLTGQYAQSIENLREWLSKHPNWETEPVPFEPAMVAELKKAMGKDASFVGLHALMDYARLLNADDKSAFRTSIYVEADGVTNGPINASVMMSAGAFDEQQLKVFAKGGLFITGTKKTMNDHRSNKDGTGDTVDLYETAMGGFQGALQTMQAVIGSSADAQVPEQMNAMLRVLSALVPDISFDPQTGTVTLARGVTKNPLTITIYGSGAMGIASKFAGIMEEELYAKISAGLTLQAQNPSMDIGDAMFGEGNGDKFDSLMADLNLLMSGIVVRAKKNGQFMFIDKPTKPNESVRDLSKFTFNPDERANISSNLMTMFVAPMREGITAAVGKSTLRSADIIQKATQIQSVFLANEFQSVMRKYMDEKAKADPDWKRHEGLSQDELAQIQKELDYLSPLVQTGVQNFAPAASQSVDTGIENLSSALDGSFRMKGTVRGPSDAGVRGIPMMVIGMGDGNMMQKASVGAGRPLNTLKIFDGMNMPLSTMKEDSVRVNAAAFDSWMSNPVRAVSESYSKFLKAVDKVVLPDAALIQIHRTLSGETLERISPSERKAVIDAVKEFSTMLTTRADVIDARHAVLKKVNTFTDQMASTGDPYENVGDVLSGTQEEVVQQLNSLLKEELSTPKVEVPKATPEFEKVLNQVGRGLSSGVRILSMTALKKVRQIGDLSADQKVIFDQAVRSLEGKSYTVISGSLDQVTKYRDAQGLGPVPAQVNGEMYGWTDTGLKHVYVINPAAETLVHELIHASTIEAVLGHYNGTSTPEMSDAIQRIEVLKAQFEDLSETISEDSREAYESARAAIAQYETDLGLDTPTARAGALNEFMAWALSNQNLIQEQKQTIASSLVQLAKDVVATIRSLIWGRKVAPKVGTDMLSNLQFNAAVIMRGQPTTQGLENNMKLFQNMVFGNDARLAQISEVFTKTITDFLEPNHKDSVDRENQYTRAVMVALETARNATAAGFYMKAQEKNVFMKIVGALATTAKIDPSAMAYAQDLYAHTVKNLTVEDFMADPLSQHPADRYYAQKKYDVVVGNLGGKRDATNRTTVLPVFLGLAMTNDSFRAVLAKKELPKSANKSNDTLDNILTNVGTTAMDKLNAAMAGTKLSDKTVLAAVNSLTDHVIKESIDKETFIDQVAAQAGGVVDRMNQYVVDGVERLSDAVIDKAKKIEANSQNQVVKLAASTTRLLANMATDKNGQLVAQGVISAANRVNMWKPFHNLLIDLVGRTSTNSGVYDLIKAVRSMVQQDRQQFREELPEIIAKRFTRPLADAEWGTMYKTLAKTDIMAMRSHYKVPDLIALLGDDKARAGEIKRLESSIQSAAPRNWNLYQKKAKQLANFMNTGVVGNNLLRNAEAVSRLLGERANVAVPSQQTVSELDRLISLYAFSDLPQADRDALSSLVQSEAEGVSFVMSYLEGLRKDETERAQQGMARLNHYKGFTPNNQQDGVSLIIREDKEFTKWSERSYQRIADYKGSAAEGVAGTKKRMGYYFAPVTGRAAFSQGIMQNVRSTGYGVDVSTGYSTGYMTAGRITSKPVVDLLAKNLGLEKGTNENLMPVYDEDGTVIAFERSVDPVHLTLLNPSNHLGKMMGSWAGRQVEERKGVMFNEVLIDSLHDMWKKDVAGSPSKQKEYVNLFDSRFVSKDPVLADALALMTPQTQDYISGVFPKDEFWVRKDMVEDAVGYRIASVGDAWTGNTRLHADVNTFVKNATMRLWGNDAYKMMVNAEEFIQNYVRDVKSLIVVKSVVVPAVNFVANMLQMIGRGVPMKSIGLGMARKTAELNAYTKSRVRYVEADAELKAATGNVTAERKLKAEMQSIKDSWTRLSIWPLLEAGEFSAISDASISQDEMMLYEGKLAQYMDKLMSQLPEGIRTAGRYALVTKDTALFKGMQTAVQYGDFLAKSIMFDHLTETKKMSASEAMGKITEEFVNYDRLPGRFRGYGESIGLLWFYNFKIRSAKIAVSMIRNNPVHTLLAGLVPTPSFFGSVGTPVDDNLFSLAAEGRLPFSVGPGQGLGAFHLNPWVNLAN